MASSSVILTGPCVAAAVCARTIGDAAAQTETTQKVRTVTRRQPTVRRGSENIGLGLKGFLRCWKLVTFPCDPDIERRQQEDTQRQVGNETAHDDNRKRTLRVRSDGVGHGGRQKPEGGH